VPVGVVGWWPLDESTGSTAGDLISGFTGFHSGGPTPVVGVVDTALKFDGSNDHVRVPDNPALNIAGDVTVDMWFRLDATGHYELLSKGGLLSGANTDLPSSYFVETNSGMIRAGFEADNGANHFVSAPHPTDGQWHFVAYRRSGNLNQLYLDSLLAAENTAAITPGSTAGYDLYVGAVWDYSGIYLRFKPGSAKTYCRFPRLTTLSTSRTIRVGGSESISRDRRSTMQTRTRFRWRSTLCIDGWTTRRW
jgi:hypothetical protein